MKKNKSLDISRSSQISDVRTKIIKENTELFTDFIHSALNEAIQSGNFLSYLKWADVTPIFKKGLKDDMLTLKDLYLNLNIRKFYL